VGWKIGTRTAPGGEKDYRNIQRSDGGSAGGVFGLTADMQQHGARPCWLGYLHVSDVDAATRAIEADGGKVLMPTMKLPVGSIAMVTDPMGAPFYVMTPIPPPGQPDAKSDVFAPAAQRTRWNELATADLARAKGFYSKHFNFRFDEVMPMGPMGDYCFIDHDGVRLGGMMQQQAGQPGMWLFYFGVESVLAAQRAIERNGGKVVQAPHEVPGGGWVMVALDPAGAAFAVTGPKGE
jgi:predicted enzyme related to lactoylglutathione lyase